MEALNIGILTALAAGVISFASPCVLPIVPGYLSFITGLGMQDFANRNRAPSILRKAAINSIAFVAGFSLIFILLGASATVIGTLLRQHLGTLSKIAGVMIIVLGLHMTGILRIPFLMYDKRLQGQTKAKGIGRSFVAGLVFAFGWTPCIGPILAGILALAAVQETASRGVLLLSAYSMGLGVPFILSGLFLNGFFSAFAKIKQHLHKVEVAGGLMLLAIGMLMLSGKLNVISQKLDFMNPERLLNKTGSPTQVQQAGPPNSFQLHGQEDSVAIKEDARLAEFKVNLGRYDFRLETTDGRTIRLSDYGGKVVLVNIWAPWCGPCRLETPGFVKLYEDLNSKGFAIIGVAVQTNSKNVESFIEEYKIRWPIGIDDNIARSYGTYGLPDNYLFAADVSLIKHFVGLTDEETLRPLIERALNNSKRNSAK